MIDTVALIVPTKRRRGMRIQVLPGLLGDFCCINSQGETVVRVKKRDGLRALDRLEQRYRNAPSDGNNKADAEYLALIEKKRELFR